MAAAVDVATVAVVSTQFVFAGLVSAARVLWAHRCAGSGQLGPNASGLAREAAAVDNYGENERHLVTFSLALGCAHVVAEGRWASLRTVWVLHTTCRSSLLSALVSSD